VNRQGWLLSAVILTSFLHVFRDQCPFTRARSSVGNQQTGFAQYGFDDSGFASLCPSHLQFRCHRIINKSMVAADISQPRSQRRHNRGAGQATTLLVGQSISPLQLRATGGKAIRRVLLDFGVSHP
jgi:hypothetical protein